MPEYITGEISCIIEKTHRKFQLQQAQSQGKYEQNILS